MKGATVIDRYERCKKIVAECLSTGRSQSDCDRQADMCRDVYRYKKVPSSDRGFLNGTFSPPIVGGRPAFSQPKVFISLS